MGIRLVKEDTEQEILEILKRERFGLNIQILSEKLGYSRNTITKYLKILEDKEKVICREIGQNFIWIHKDVYYDKIDKTNPISSLIFSIYTAMMKNIEKIDVSTKKVKDLGKYIAEEFNFSDYIDKSYLQISNAISDSMEIADLFMKIIDSICKFYDEYSWSSPIIVKDKSIIILRMHNSDLIDTPNHFYLISGFIEYEMNKQINEFNRKIKELKNPIKGNVDIVQINKEKKIVDFQFEFIF
jgi:DNA-binding transcriptional ArsR family regulator